MNKIPGASQSIEAKTLPADVCIFGHFGWLSPAAFHSADCRFDSGSMFQPLSHIYTKTPFCCIETVANNALNCWCVVVFDQLWANAAPTLKHNFLIDKCSCKIMNTLLSDIFQLLCYLMQLQFAVAYTYLAFWLGCLAFVLDGVSINGRFEAERLPASVGPPKGGRAATFVPYV